MVEQPDNQSPRDSYKRWFDISVLLAAHIILLPVWILLWTLLPILIWIGDRGPIFYKQQRIGKNRRTFTIRKFRTMVPDAENHGSAWTVERDPRVTPFGRVLRRTALDELPEILSIWKGDMSLVGPRALDVREQLDLERQVPGFERRLEITPGLTGMAQLYDLADSAPEKIRFDLEYRDRMNPWLDARLILLSIKNTIFAKWDNRKGKPAAPTSYMNGSRRDSATYELSETDRIDQPKVK